jgi:two-component SAPR family response regulator
MGGRDLAAQLHEVRPSVRILFISGYSEDVVCGGSGDFGMAFLGKPFTPLVLTRRVREILDSPALVIA